MEFNTFQWIALAVTGFLSLFGISKVIEIQALWRVERKKNQLADEKSRDGIHATNQGRLLDAEEKFNERILLRLEKFEVEQEKFKDQLTTQLIMNTKLETENAHLKLREDEQSKKIAQLEDINGKQALKIVNLENQVQTLESSMLLQKQQFADLNKKFNNLQHKRKTD